MDNTGLRGEGRGGLRGDNGVEKMWWEGVQGKFKWEEGMDMFKIHCTHIQTLKE